MNHIYTWILGQQHCKGRDITSLLAVTVKPTVTKTKKSGQYIELSIVYISELVASTPADSNNLTQYKSFSYNITRTLLHQPWTECCS